MIMFYNYLIESEKNKILYTGYTSNLKKRLREHINKSTKPYIPWKLVYYEACLEIEDAKRREKYLKTTQGKRLLKRRLKDYLYKNK